MRKPLRIAQVFLSSADHFGGVQSYVYYLSKTLARIGHRVSVFGCGEKPVYPYQDFSSIGQGILLPTPYGDWPTLGFSGAKLDSLLKKVNSGSSFDICHIHEPYIPFIGWQLLSQIKHLPIIVTFHAGWEETSAANILFNSIFPLFRRHLATNITAAIYTSRVTHTCWHRIFAHPVYEKVIPSGIEREIFAGPARRPKKQGHSLKLLYVARLVPKKGVMDLLQIFLRLRHDKYAYSLTIIGDGPQNREVKSFIARHSLHGWVNYFGPVSESDKARAYQEADVFCAPYLDEGFGITLLEAMAAGLPIVGYRNRAFHELLREYPEPSLLVPVHDKVALSAALQKVYREASVRNVLRRWLRRESRKYTWESVAGQVVEFSMNVLSQRR